MGELKKDPIKHRIQQQLEVNQSKNLLYVNAGQVMELDPGFLAALEELLASSDSGVQQRNSSEMASFASQELLKRLYSINQFLRIEPQKVKELEEIYRQTWRLMLKTRNLQTVLREYHYPELSRWLSTVYPEEFREPLKLAPLVGHVVCEQYSAQLQIELLSIDATQLKQPVLDVGCGSRANLVRYLRSLDIQAYGFDRSLEIHAPYLDQKDWFEYAFESRSWGTVVSNMAFTNHLNYARLHDVSQLERYLLKMKDMIESLVSGGRFVYAPSLPFVEESLAIDRFKVEHRRAIGNISVSTITRIAG
jgi:hypothetical protein